MKVYINLAAYGLIILGIFAVAMMVGVVLFNDIVRAIRRKRQRHRR